jgi:drug/metabolite transporter (DMT)-like permease
LSSLCSISKGVAYVATSGICWGFHGVMIKYALGLGASFMQIFFVEVLFACVFFSLFWSKFFKQIRPSSFSQWFRLLIIGLATVGVGYFLFLSYSLGPVAIPATLMFLYLPLVYGLSLLKKYERLSLIKIAAIASVLLGATLTTQIITTFSETNILASVIMATCASVCYAIVFILTPEIGKYATAEFRSFTVSGIGLLGCITILLFDPSLWYDLGGNSLRFCIFAILLGVIGQTMPVIFLMKGLPLTGSSLGGVVASIELPIAVFSAYALLGETLTLLKITGVFLVLRGIAIYNLADRFNVGRYSRINQTIDE